MSELNIPVDQIFLAPNLGKTAGILKWRIENKQVVQCPNADGNFYTGDAYIVLVTVKNNSKIENTIHFWLGEDCSTDESGIAAYKSVELSVALGGSATQYRECQGNESTLFASFFKNSGGIHYLAGGVDSGFNHVERDSWPTRLLHIKGKRNVRVFEEAVSNKSLTQDDVYVLDMGLNIYLWYGPNSNRYEKTKALEVVTHLNNDQRGGRAKFVRVTEDDPMNAEFWSALGGYLDASSVPLGDSDDTIQAFAPNALLRVSGESVSDTQIEEVHLENGKMTKDMLNSSYVFIIMSQGNIFIWVGRQSSFYSKMHATTIASNYALSKGLSRDVKITRVAEGSEPGAFTSCFAVWIPQMSYKRLANIASNLEEHDIDVAALLARKAKSEKSVDDGSGKVEVFVVKDFNLEPISQNYYGEFFGGDSYVIVYTHLVNGKERGIVYFWQGNDSSADERATSALMAKEISDKRFHGAATQVRITQGKEPSHFRSIFKGLMIIHEGGNASGFGNRSDQDSKDVDGVALFHVKNTNNSNAYGVQVPEKASELNGEDCFVLVTPATTYCWAGNGADETEKVTAQAIANKLSNNYLNAGGRALVNVTEGNEDDDFWAFLGGKAPYAEFSPGVPPPRPARLFEASTAKGVFNVEEIDNFTQDDLCNDDVYLLDMYTQLFVWIGGGSTEEERQKASEIAQNYVSHATDGRDKGISITTVYAGFEPAMFTQHFLPWDPAYAEKRSFKDPYSVKLAAMQAAEKANADARANAEPTRRASVKDPLEERRAALQAAEEKKRADILMANEAIAAADAAAIKDPLAERRAALKAAEDKKRADLLAEHEKNEKVVQAVVFDSPAGKKYSLAELQGKVAGVDPSKKEDYLSDADFQTVFSMGRSEFSAQPAWKTKAAKQKAGLF